MSAASMMSGALQIISGYLSNAAMPQMKNAYGNAVPFYFAAGIVGFSTLNCLFGLKDVLVEHKQAVRKSVAHTAEEDPKAELKILLGEAW